MFRILTISALFLCIAFSTQVLAQDLPPEIVVRPQRIETEVETGSIAIEEFDIVIDNVGGSPLIFETSIDYIDSPDSDPSATGWVGCDPTAGVIAEDDQLILILYLDPCGLGHGDYEADLHILSNAPYDPDVEINIVLRVTASEAEELISQLIIYVENLNIPDEIGNGERTSCLNFLGFALAALGSDPPNIDGANGVIFRLTQFIDHVDKAVDKTPPKISPAEGLILRNAANEIIVLLGGSWIYASDPGIALTEQTPVPSDYYLSHAYPNPFNSVTRLSYGLPEASHVTIGVYDMSGRLVAQLVDAELEAGHHMAVWDASEVPSGVYLCRMEAGQYHGTVKLMLLR